MSTTCTSSSYVLPGKTYKIQSTDWFNLDLKLDEIRRYSSVPQTCRQVNPTEMVSVHLPGISTCLLDKELSHAINNRFTGDCRASSRILASLSSSLNILLFIYDHCRQRCLGAVCPSQFNRFPTTAVRLAFAHRTDALVCPSGFILSLFLTQTCACGAVKQLFTRLGWK